MAAIQVIIRAKPLRLHRAQMHAEFNAPIVIADDPWEFVAMWLKQRKPREAEVYWEQARQFAQAAEALPPRSAPLPAYYSMLNATKALLLVQRQAVPGKHGVAGGDTKGPATLNREQITFSNGGVLGSLRTYLGDGASVIRHTLKDVLFNLAFVHRAYCVTFGSDGELFVPVESPVLVRKAASHEAWFEFEPKPRYANASTLATLGSGLEKDGGREGFIVRLKNRMQWLRGRSNRVQSLSNLRNYHVATRRRFQYIAGDKTLWYAKRSTNRRHIDLSPPVLMFSAMHRLSELSRYRPDRLERHLESQHNWLLCEFIRQAPRQFIDCIAAELTGREILPTRVRP